MTTIASDLPARARARIDAVDLARGLALLAMAVYHFTWDLDVFGYVPQGLSQQGGWKIFARGIASSFLLLVGFSLVLAHGDGIRWRQFHWRLLRVSAAAAVITLATWVATPERFIFFGILHQIVFASLAGLLILRVNTWILLVLAAVIVAGPHLFRSPFFDAPALWWVGLSSHDPPSNDYVPVFPWMAAVLTGMALAKFGTHSGFLERLSRFRAGKWARPLRFISRHSLAFYLLHQPLLIAGLFVFSQFVPAERTPEAAFMRSCEQSCSPSLMPEACSSYCACVLDGLADSGKLDEALSDDAKIDQDPIVREIIGICNK